MMPVVRRAALAAGAMLALPVAAVAIGTQVDERVSRTVNFWCVVAWQAPIPFPSLCTVSRRLNTCLYRLQAPGISRLHSLPDDRAHDGERAQRGAGERKYD